MDSSRQVKVELDFHNPVMYQLGASVANFEEKVDIKIEEHEIKIEKSSFPYFTDISNNISTKETEFSVNKRIIKEEQIDCEGDDILSDLNFEAKEEPLDFKTYETDNSSTSNVGLEVLPNNNNNNLKIHMSTDTDQCDTTFSEIIYSQSGDKFIHKAYQCGQCDKVFLLKDDLTSHMSIHTEDKPYQSNQYNTAVSYKTNIKTHVRKHTGDKPYTYSQYAKALSENNSLTAHVQTTTTGGKAYRCSFCDKAFTIKYNLECHLRTHIPSAVTSYLQSHTDEILHQCSFCDKTFTIEYNLKCHLRTHTDKTIYKCMYSHCNKSFLQECDLIIHVKTHIGDKKYQCSQNEKVISHNNNLTTHAQKTADGKAYICNYCDKAFTIKYKLECHLRTHTKNIRRRSYLQVHTNDTVYQCSYCDKAFASKYNLKCHLRTHTQASSPKPHLQTHTDETQYQCSFCDKAFTIQYNLKCHMRTHTENKIVK